MVFVYGPNILGHSTGDDLNGDDVINIDEILRGKWRDKWVNKFILFNRAYLTKYITFNKL